MIIQLHWLWTPILQFSPQTNSLQANQCTKVPVINDLHFFVWIGYSRINEGRKKGCKQWASDVTQTSWVGDFKKNMLLNWKDVWYEHSINGLLSEIGLVAVNIINKLKDKTTRCFSITSNYIWPCVQYCYLDIGGVSFKAAVHSQLSLETSFKFMIINPVDILL